VIWRPFLPGRHKFLPAGQNRGRLPAAQRTDSPCCDGQRAVRRFSKVAEGAVRLGMSTWVYSALGGRDLANPPFLRRERAARCASRC
jgi:hypothetical protein